MERSDDDSELSKMDLAAACAEGDYEHASDLLATGCDPITSRAGYFNWSPLHYSARHGNLQFADLLISQYSCSPQVEDKEGRTPLHIACQYGQLKFARYLIQQKRCDASYLDIEDQTPLHHTCGWLSECTEESALTITRFLIESAKCDPNEKDVNGKSCVLHACEKGFISVLKYFVEERKCDLQVTDYKGNNALHLAVSFSKSFEIVSYIMDRNVLDLTSANNRGNNVLHMAAIANASINIISFILKQKESSLLIQSLNDDGLSPFDVANHEIARFILTRFQIHSEKFYEKYSLSLGVKQSPSPNLRVFVLGDLKSGKTTLINSLHKETSSFSSSLTKSFSSQSPTRLTFEDPRGVTMTHFESKFFGHATFYDFSGNSSYKCIQQAVLRSSILPGFSIFLVVVDQSKPSQEVQVSLLHWLEFLAESWKENSSNAKVIVVGSHSDLVKSGPKTVRTRLKSNPLETPESTSKNFEILLKVHVDCHKSESSGVNNVRKHLATFHGKTETKSALSFNACCLLMLLHSNFSSSHATSLRMILTCIQQYKVGNGSISDVRYFLSEEADILARLLVSLHEAGHILFYRDELDLGESVVVIEASEMFSDLTKLWNREKYPNLLDDRNLAPLSSVAAVFPDQDVHSIVRVLTELSLCSQLHFPMNGCAPECLYIPSLLSNSAVAKDMWDVKCSYKLNYGWILMLKHEDQSFSRDFVYDILQCFLVVSTKLIKKMESVSLWKDGVYLRSSTEGGIFEVLFEIGDSLHLLMRSQKFDSFCLKFRSSASKAVRQCIKESSRKYLATEYLMDPFETTSYPLPSSLNLTLFSATDVIDSMVSGDSLVRSHEGVSIPLNKILYFEPFAFVNFNLLSDANLEDRVSDAFLKSLHESLAKDTESYLIMLSVLSVETIKTSVEALYNSMCSYFDDEDKTYSSLISLFHNFSCFSSHDLTPAIRTTAT